MGEKHDHGFTSYIPLEAALVENLASRFPQSKNANKKKKQGRAERRGGEGVV